MYFDKILNLAVKSLKCRQTFEYLSGLYLEENLYHLISFLFLLHNSMIGLVQHLIFIATLIGWSYLIGKSDYDWKLVIIIQARLKLHSWNCTGQIISFIERIRCICACLNVFVCL